MNLNDTKSSKDLRKEITQELDRLDTNIDALKDRVSPGQMIDDAIFRNYRGDPKRSFNYLKANPVGSSFLALGTLLLMENEGESYEQYLKKQSKIAYQEYRTKAAEVKLKAVDTKERMARDVKKKTRELMQQGEEKLQSIKQKVSRKGQEIEASVTQVSDDIRDNVIDATESFKERAQQVRGELQTESTGKKMQDMKRRAGEYGRNVSLKFKENGYDSLAYLSIGLGTGFATGSLIPLGEEVEGDLGLDFDFSQLRNDLEQAVNESVNLFKNEMIDGLKNRNVDIF